MISGPNSPFYKALIEPEIGSDYSSVVGCVRMGKALKPAKLFCGIKTIPSKGTIFLFSVAVQSVLLVNALVWSHSFFSACHHARRAYMDQHALQVSFWGLGASVDNIGFLHQFGHSAYKCLTLGLKRPSHSCAACWNETWCRYDGSTREASFRVGLQGMAEEDAEKVKQIISQTIDDIVE